MTDISTRALDTFPQWLKSLGDDAVATAALLSDDAIPTSSKRLLAGGLNYLFKSLDLIPDGIEDLGYLDDAFVLRFAAALAVSDRPAIANATLARLAGDVALVRELLGDVAGRLEAYVRGLENGAARGRSVDQIVSDEHVRRELVSEVSGWAGAYEAPSFTRDEKTLVKLRSFLGSKLPA